MPYKGEVRNYKRKGFFKGSGRSYQPQQWNGKEWVAVPWVSGEEPFL